MDLVPLWPAPKGKHPIRGIYSSPICGAGLVNSANSYIWDVISKSWRVSILSLAFKLFTVSSSLLGAGTDIGSHHVRRSVNPRNAVCQLLFPVKHKRLIQSFGINIGVSSFHFL